MKKIVKKLILLVLIMNLFTPKVFAECSYKERSQLLKEAKGVDISYEPIELEDDTYDFKFNIVGLTENLSITYSNNYDNVEKNINYNELENGVYSFIDENTFDVYDYTFYIKSNNSNCIDYELTSKKVIKPKYNLFSENINCTSGKNDDFKYCAKFLEKDEDITLEEFNVKITEFNINKILNQDNEIEPTNRINFVAIYIGIAGLSIGIIILAIILIKKKRREL